jgi:hypothetical protein
VDDAHDGPYAREPQIEDLVRICRALNEAGARCLLIGGFAVIAHGGARTTKETDLLIDASSDNVSRVKQALRILEDRAIDQVADTDVARYTVVRVADEVVVDLMAQACGLDYGEAAKDAKAADLREPAVALQRGRRPPPPGQSNRLVRVQSARGLSAASSGASSSSRSFSAPRPSISSTAS